jgi:two-component system, NtrC family, response regulator AtoC
VLVGAASRLAAGGSVPPGGALFLRLPLDRTALERLVRSLGEAGEVAGRIEEAWGTRRFHSMVGRSPVAFRFFEQVSRVCRSSATVLITGESGSGKELVARTIHDLGRRSSGPFVAVNAGAIAPTLIESEFFGHEPGSFTGASRTHRGFFERADRGTLLLDEVTEMPPELQVKLLRVLEAGRVTRLGGEEDRPVDVRVIASTNRNPREAVRQGALREDLYYRLRVLRLHVPPLRRRREDVIPLAEHFLEEFIRREGKRKSLSDEAVSVLEGYGWPGNVRELRNAIYTGYLLSAGEEITADALPPDLTGSSGIAHSVGAAVRVRVGDSLEDAERRLILETLAHMRGNKTRTAEVLGISLKTLYNRLHAYGVMPSDDEASEPS